MTYFFGTSHNQTFFIQAITTKLIISTLKNYDLIPTFSNPMDSDSVKMVAGIFEHPEQYKRPSIWQKEQFPDPMI